MTNSEKLTAVVSVASVEVNKSPYRVKEFL
jgi:hypothetical protein